MRSVSQGLRVGPKRRGSVTGRMPNSGRLVLPTMTKPASRSRRTTNASWAGTKSPNASEPSVYGMPATGAVSLIAIGTPAKGRSSPAPDGVGGGEGAVGVDVHERVEVAVEGLDALERRLGELARAELAAADEAGELGGRSEEQLGIHGGASLGESGSDRQEGPLARAFSPTANGVEAC